MSLRRLIVCLAAVAGLGLTSAPLYAVTVGQVDNFSVDLSNWSSGRGLERVTTGGPAGAGDAFLRNESFGGANANSGKMVIKNETQWTGDFLAAGVTAVSMDVRNLGSSAITLRVAMGNSTFPGSDNQNPVGEWMVTTLGVNLPALGAWTNVRFQLGEGDFTGQPYANIIDSVLGFRIVNASTTANPGKGDEVAAILGVDNITALAGGTPIAGDFDGMNGVNGADLTQWKGDYLLNGESDADNDGDSDGNDFLIWQRNLGMGTVVAASSPLPEPSGLAIVLPWAALAARGRRRRCST